MRRWILTCLLMLLPIQFSWAAVAAYCQHERGGLPARNQHLGHHEHQHAGGKEPGKSEAQAQPLAQADNDSGKGDSRMDRADPDCRMCHGLGLGVLWQPAPKWAPPRASTWAGPTVGHLPQHTPHPPERPQWPRLA
ncbi:DUF2946 family protein [Acidovorax sp. DW039]|uniref:hypothetical protein n=1 Tax=Acidovorax sp. DW039 TaxID=3095606 RepID=UPI00308D59F3|nr:DUF2946 family protein [Acidovorax sp. DW039]